MISHNKKLALEIKDNLVYYKLRHIPTGLFYRPTSYRNKSNLAITGQIYIKKPIYILREGPLSNYRDKNFNKLPIILDEWQIVVYKVKIQAVEEIPKELERPKNEGKRSTNNSTINSAQKGILEDLKNAIKPKTK